MNVFVPVQYPLTETTKQAIQRGIDLVEGDETSELLIFHMNEVQKDRRINRRSLRDTVETTQQVVVQDDRGSNDTANTNTSESTDDSGPGFGIGSSVVGTGGMAYPLRQRLTESEDE